MNLRRPVITQIGVAIITIFIGIAVLAPFLTAHDPRAVTGDSLEKPSSNHFLGTNDIGQDIFSELVWGARQSLGVAIGGAALVLAVGIAIGLGAALAGGFTETVVMRIIDLFLALPVFPLLILIAALAGPSPALIVLVIGFLGWPMMARVVRSRALSLRRSGFVTSAQGFGGGIFYIIRRHLAPALGPIISAGFVTMAGVAIVLEAGLAFLGLGDPTGVSWGMVINRALSHQGLYLSELWIWWVLPAGMAVTVAVLGFTFIGIGLDPRFNPRARRTA